MILSSCSLRQIVLLHTLIVAKMRATFDSYFSDYTFFYKVILVKTFSKNLSTESLSCNQISFLTLRASTIHRFRSITQFEVSILTFLRPTWLHTWKLLHQFPFCVSTAIPTPFFHFQFTPQFTLFASALVFAFSWHSHFHSCFKSSLPDHNFGSFSLFLLPVLTSGFRSQFHPSPQSQIPPVVFASSLAPVPTPSSNLCFSLQVSAPFAQ